MNCVFLKSNKMLLFLLFSLQCNAQYKAILKKDINLDKKQDIVYKDTITNTLIFNYGKNLDNKQNDSLYFFSNYGAETGSLHLKEQNKYLNISFTYAPKYLDFDLLSFVYDKNKEDWILISAVSSRTNYLSPTLETTICKYKIQRKVNFSLKNNNFDQFQEMILDNKKYLIKCFEENLE